MKVEGWLKRSRKEKRAHWPNFYIFYHLSYEKLFLSIFSSSLGSSYAHSLLKMDHISKCIFLPLQRALVRVRCRKYCQYFRIGMKQDLFSPWTNHSWYRLLGFSLFLTHCKAKRMLWFVFWKVWSGTKAKLCWTGGPTSLKKGPQRLFNLDSTAVWNCFKKKGLPMSLSENSVCSLNQI